MDLRLISHSVAMTNPKSLENLKSFEPGQSGNPGGSTQGMRRKIQGKFLETLAADFDKNGKQAIIDCREKKPDVYMKVCASLLPKEIDLKNPLDEIDDTTLALVLSAVRAALASSPAAAVGSRAAETEGPAQAH